MMTDKLNLPWRNSNFIVLDLEGSGSQHRENEGIVEIAAIQINNAQLTNDYFYRLLNPEIEIPPMISRIHGLKNKDLESEPVFGTIKDQLFDLLNDKILVGHNVNVDYRVLKLKMPDYRPSLILDTMKLSKHFWSSEKRHGLDDLIQRFEIDSLLSNLPIKRNRHSAFYDAFATGIIFLKIIEGKFSKDASLKTIADICSINPDANNTNQISLF